MIISLELIGTIAAIITIFSAGIAVGRYIERNKNDRP